MKSYLQPAALSIRPRTRECHAGCLRLDFLGPKSLQLSLTQHFPLHFGDELRMRKPLMQKVVVLGATSGIMQPLLRMMAKDGKQLLLVGRSQERLDTLRSDLLAHGS